MSDISPPPPPPPLLLIFLICFSHLLVVPMKKISTLKMTNNSVITVMLQMKAEDVGAV